MFRNKFLFTVTNLKQFLYNLRICYIDIDIDGLTRFAKKTHICSIQAMCTHAQMHVMETMTFVLM